MVQSIIIPASDAEDMRTIELGEVEDYEKAVGGWIEALDIPDLGVTMYVNEEGLIRDLPFNRRATLLWRFHVPQARDASLVGDVAVVGLTDNAGESTELPDQLRRRLLEPGVYRVWTQERGSSHRHEEPIDRDDYLETVIWAALLQEMSPTLEVQIEHVEGVEGESNNQP